MTVIGRISTFLFISIIILIGLFFLGNVQEFMDSTQAFLLRSLDAISPIFLIAAVCHVLLLIFESIRIKSFKVGKLLLTILGIALVSGLFIFSSFLNSWIS